MYPGPRAKVGDAGCGHPFPFALGPRRGYCVGTQAGRTRLFPIARAVFTYPKDFLPKPRRKPDWITLCLLHDLAEGT